MAKITFEGDTLDVDAGYIIETCEDLGIPFGCRGGTCGTCEVRVLKGKDSLSPKSEAEIDFGLEDNYRLACQCVIKQDGDVEISL